MTDKPGRDLVPSSGGVFHDILIRIKLILRLMLDRRVSLFLKLLPIGSLVYLVLPDFLPGPIDDAAMIALLSYLFVELCPEQVVQEHMRALTSVVDADWREVDEEEERKQIHD
jgi:uncharacterized membrane protein YkvA (DUF1232 family)